MNNLLLKIRGIPERERKIVFWIIMIILALTLSTFYIKYIQEKVANIGLEKTKEELQINSLDEILNKVQEVKIPKIEMPEINQETLRELKKIMEEAPTTSTSCEPTD